VAFAERWNGSWWSVQRGVQVTGGLAGVSCPSGASCTAVGTRTPNRPGLTAPLVERWHHARWLRQPIPTPYGHVSSGLSGVSCLSATGCTAVGSFSNPDSGEALAEHWNGIAWSIQLTTGFGGLESGSESAFSSVVCVRRSSCTAVGYAGDPDGASPLVGHWNGTVWSVRPAPTNGYSFGGDDLTGVSCTSTVACTAVGMTIVSIDDNYHFAPLVERWDGINWSRQSAPGIVGASGTVLTGVSCPATHLCSAVGYSQSSSNPPICSTYPQDCDGQGVYCTEYPQYCPRAPVVALWNGEAWSTQPAPEPAGTTDGYLSGISCSSRTACVAVGSVTNSSGITTPLVERYF
jgi:hypothetical protein